MSDMSEDEGYPGEETTTPEEEKAEHAKYLAEKYRAGLQDARDRMSATACNTNNNNNRAPRVAPAPAPQEQESAAARKVLETDVSRYLKPEGAHGEHDIAWSTTAGFRFRETGVDEKWTQ